MSYHFLLDLALILLSTKVLGIITKKFQMPQVVGSLLAGLLLGPSMLNVLQETEFLDQISELGVIVILFTAGVGTSIQDLKESGKAGFWVALIVANRGLEMGVISQTMMTPVIITVVACSILTPVLLKLAYRGEGTGRLEESGLTDRVVKPDQLDILSDELLQKDQELMKRP